MCLVFRGTRTWDFPMWSQQGWLECNLLSLEFIERGKKIAASNESGLFGRIYYILEGDPPPLPF